MSELRKPRKPRQARRLPLPLDATDESAVATDMGADTVTMAPMSEVVGRLDWIDRRIIADLQVDGRKKYSIIGRELGVAESVVRYRVQRLQSERILQIVGIADPLRIGFDHFALVGLRVRPGMTEAVCAQLATMPETSYVVAVAGAASDAIAEVVCRDTRHFAELLNRRIQVIDGVVSTDVFFVTEVYKMAYGWGVPEVAPSDVTRHEQPSNERNAP